MPRLIAVDGCPGLVSLDQSLYTGGPIVSVKVQGVKDGDSGAIEEHDHREENLWEVLFLVPGSEYGGLTDPRIIRIANSAVIPPGVPHGSLEIPTCGQLISLKIDGLLIRESSHYNGVCTYHNFRGADIQLVVAVSNKTRALETVLHQTDNPPGTAWSTKVILNLPLIKDFTPEGEYTPRGLTGRMLGIKY